MEDLEEFADLPLDENHFSALFKVAEKELGNFTMWKSNLTSFDGGYKLFGRGATVKDVESGLPSGGELLDDMKDIKSTMGDASRKKIGTVYGKLKDTYKLDETRDVCIDEPLVEDMAPFFTHASLDDLQKLRPTSRKSVLKTIGNQEDSVKKMTRSKLKSFTRQQIQDMNLNRGDIDVEQVEELGPHLLCGMELEDARKLTDRAIEEFLHVLESCEQLEQDVRMYVTHRVVNNTGGLSELLEKPARMENLGTLLTYIDPESVEDLPSEKLEMLEVKVTEMVVKMEDRTEDLMKRSGADIPRMENNEEHSRSNELISKVFEKSHRGDMMLDCASIQKFHGELSFLNATDISSLQADEFEDCLEDFARSDWSDSQLQTIGRKMKEAFGRDTTSWDEETTMRLGPLIKALPAQDVAKMNFTKDSLAVLGQFEMGNDASREIVNKFVKDEGLRDVSQMSSEQLGTMGKLVCGISADAMANLSSQAVNAAIDELGRASCLDEKQLMELGDKVESEIGRDWSELTPDKVAQMGVLIGGASQEALSSLGQEQIANIGGETLQKIPPKKFAQAFTEEKLEQLSDEQVLYLTSEHVWRMSKGQREALSNFTRKAGIDVPKASHGPKMSDRSDIQAGRRLSRTSCGSNLAFAGQQDSLLTSSRKIANFGSSLMGDTKVFFDKLVQSPDHSIDGFTEVELKSTLAAVMDMLDTDEREDYLDIIDSLDYIPTDKLKEILETLPPSIYLLQTEDAMCEMTSKLDHNLLHVFCNRLMEDQVSAVTVTQVLDRCADCMVLAYKDREADVFKFMLDEAKGAMFYRKLRQWQPRDWDMFVLAISPAAVKAKDIDRITNTSHFQDRSQLMMLSDERMTCCLPEPVKKGLAMKLHAALGSLSDWTEKDIGLLESYILYLPSQTLKRELSPQFVLKAIDQFDVAEGLSRSQEKALTIAAWVLVDKMEADPAFFNMTDKEKSLCLIVKFASRRSVFEQLCTAEELKQGLIRCSGWNISKENSGRALTAITSSSNFTWTPDMVALMVNMSAGVTTTMLDSMDMMTLEGSWDMIKESNLALPVLRAAWARLKDNYTVISLSCADLMSMGQLMFAMSVTELATIPDNTLAQCASYISGILHGYCTRQQSFCKKLWTKIKADVTKTGESQGELMASMNGEFMQYIPSEDFRGLRLEELGGVDKVGKLNLTSAQAEVVMEMVEEELGPVMADNLNYTGRRLEKLSKLMYRGATPESLEQLPEGAELLDSLPNIGSMGDIDEKKMKTVYDKLHSMFGLDSASGVCLDDSTVKQTAGFFTQATDEDLRKLSNDTRQNVLSEIGNNPELVQTMSREKIRQHFQVLKEDENLESGEFTSEHIEKYGANLFCGMDADDARRLSNEAMEEHLAELDNCEQLDMDTRKLVADKVVERSGGLSGLVSDTEKLESMGSLLLHVDLSDATSLPSDKKERLGSVVGGVVDTVNRRRERLDQRSDDDVPASEKSEEKVLQNKMSRKLWDVVSDTADCQTIQGFQGDLDFLSPDDIERLEPEVVVECLDEFQETDWGQDELETFGRKIKRKFGNDTGMWKKEDMMQAGKLLGGLDSEDIDKLSLDTEVVAVLGQTDLADADKLLDKFVSDSGIRSMRSVDSDTMRAMGRMLCGMSTRDMLELQDSVVLEVSSELSQYECLNEEQLRVLGSKVESSISTKDWEKVNLQEMGRLAAGLSAEQMQQLDDDQLSSISPEAIKVMDSRTFTKAFSAEKISKLSEDQVSSVSPKMMRKMGVDQLMALENVAKGRAEVNITQAVVNATARFEIDIPANVSVRTLNTFVEVRNLQASTCLVGKGFGGQSEDRLDTVAKRDAFAATLDVEEREFFARLKASSDHDMSQFTTFEMQLALDYLLNALDDDAVDTYFNLSTKFAMLSREDVNKTVTSWPPMLHLLMKPALMCQTLGQLDVELLNSFCSHLTEDHVSTATFIEMLDRCADCLAAANAARTNDDVIGMMHGYKGRVFYDKLRQWKERDWDIYHLMFAPDALQPQDIDYITNQDNFRDIFQLYRLADERFYQKVNEQVLQRLAKKLHSALGALSDWTYLQQGLLLPYIINMPPKILKSDLTAAMVISAMPDLDDVLEVASKKFLKTAAWTVARYLIRNSDSLTRDIKEDSICLVLEFSSHKKLWTKVYSQSELFQYLPKCVEFGVSPDRISEVVKIVVTSRKFEWSSDTIESLGPFLAAVPTSTLKKVNSTLIFNNWEAVSNANFPLSTLRMFWKRFGHMVDLSTADCDLIKLLGRIFFSLKSSEIQQIPDSALGECVSYLGELLERSCDDNKVLCKKVWGKIKDYATAESKGVGEVVRELGAGFIKYLSRQDIEAIDLDDVGGVDGLAQMDVNPEHAPILMRKVTEMRGSVTKHNTNYTAEKLVKMGAVFYHGATGSEFESLPEDPSLLEMLPDMAEYFADINEKKIETVYKKLKKIFDVDGSSDICLDTALAEQIAMFFSAATDEELKSFSKSSQKVILQTLGSKYEYVRRMSRQKVQELFSVLMDLDDLATKSSYEVEDIEDYGYMWCGQKSAQAAKFSETAIDGLFSVLKKCAHLDANTRGALVSQAISVSGGLSSLLTDQPQRLEDMGSMLIDLDINLLDTLDQSDQEVLVSSTKKIMDSLTEVQHETLARPSSDISQEEKKADQAKVTALARAIFEMHLSVSFSSRRKRRSLASADCATIQSFSGELTFLTSADIASLPTDEFTDCIGEFQATEWTSEQLEAFADQLLNAYGEDTSTWTEENVLNAGILLDGLNSSHILNLTVLNDDTLSTLGTYVFTNNAEHIVTGYLNTQNVTDMSDVSAELLANTGNLICGLNTSQLADIESTVVDGASSDLSSVSCLESDQLTTLSNKIVEVRGTDWTSTTADSVSSLGVLAGGLPASVLEDLGSDEISSISTDAISYMEPATFSSVFTAEKISSLSSAQANSLTNNQLSALSPDQLNAVTQVATTAQDSDNGGATLTVTCGTLLLMTLSTLWSVTM